MADSMLTAPPPMPHPKHESLTDWTGYYTVTFVVVTCKMSDALAALPKGLTLDKSYGQQNGSDTLYPILVSVGSIEDAHLFTGSFLGINYYEIFSAIPGVQMEQGNGPLGPFIYPYRGYLNRLLPVIMGRVSGFRKYWERVSVATVTGPIPTNTDMFTVQELFSGSPILDGEFEFGASLGLSDMNRRVDGLQALLPPNIVGVGLFGNMIRTEFEFRFDKGLAWTINRAKVNIRIPDVIPGVHEPVTITYPPVQGSPTIVWPEDPRYAPVRAFVPWRLRPNNMPDALAPARLMPALPAQNGSGESTNAPAGSSGSPAASTPSPAAPAKPGS